MSKISDAENDCLMEEYLTDLYNKFREGNRRALSRILTLVENDDPAIVQVLQAIYRDVGKAHRVGITGPPGAGKSTLVNCLAQHLRKEGKAVAIVAVDPTSPFTGGALLGDRIRMTGALADEHIFMRSMASRGSSGGLARATQDAADVLDAFGFDVVIIETVGVGQLELDVAGAVDTTAVVLVPEAGGNVQAMKAGLIEIADVFVVNKADRDGAEVQRQDIEESLSLKAATGNSAWRIPILKTIAMRDQGVDELVSAIGEHHRHLVEHNQLKTRRLDQRRRKIIAIMKYRIENRLWNNRGLQPFLDSLSRLCAEGRMDPFTAASDFLKRAEVDEVRPEAMFMSC